MSDIEEILNEIRNLTPDSPTCFNYKTSRSRIRKKRTSLKKSKNADNKQKILKERKLKELKEYNFKDGEELTESECKLFLNSPWLSINDILKSNQNSNIYKYNNPLCEKPVMATAEDTDSLDKDILSRSEWDYYESSEEIIDYSSDDIE